MPAPKAHHRSIFASRRENFASERPALNRTNGLHLAGTLHCREYQEDSAVTLRIYRSSTPDAIVFALSGDMDLEHVARLQELLANETVNRVTLDLKEVTFADRAAVQFLASAEAAGIRIVNCPRYVRSWIAAESESQPQRIEELDK
jgi:hypothetical protein